MEVPDSILERLKCVYCQNYLSHPPIYHHPLVGYVCGRHPEQVTHGRFLQQTKYEFLATLLLFPCRYQPRGCSDRFSIGEMAVHEIICPCKPFVCPISECVWQKPSNKLSSHFYLHHTPIIVADNTVNNIDLVLENNLEMDIYLVALGHYFLVQCKFHKLTKTFHCCIQLFGKQSELVKKIQYEITIKTKDDRFSWPGETHMIQSYSNANSRNYDSCISLSSLNSISRTPVDVILGIKLTEVDPEDIEEVESDEDVILETIRCPICYEYMIPPIYQCIIGHSFCNSCKPKLDKCATCRQSIGSTRNYTLEKVAESVTYNCLFKTEGCKFKTKSDSIREHQLSCKFRITNCILSDINQCCYVGSQVTMEKHYDESHANFVQRGPCFQLIYVPYFSSFEVFLIKFEFDLIFKMRYGYNENDVICSVQCVSPLSDDTTYMYEMEIIDLNGNGFVLTSKKMCANLTDNVDDFKFASCWHISMVKPFISRRSQLKFKCTIIPSN